MANTVTAGPAAARHFSSLVSGPVIRFIHQHMGDSVVERVLALAGDLPPRTVLEDAGGWITYDEAERLLVAAAEVLGGREALRQACSHVDRRERAGAFEALGSPSEVLRLIAETAAKYSTVVHMEAVEITERSGIVSARSMAGFPRFDLLCAVTAGLLGQAADLFGLPIATVVEEQCETRGDERCLFRVTWSSEQDDPERRAAQLEREVVGYRTRIQNLQATVTELVSGGDVDAVLDRITSRATDAVTAHRYLLAVRTDDRSEVQVHQIGFPSAEADAVAEQLLTDDPDDGFGSRLVVDVRSGVRQYGRLAAFNPDGVGFLPEERRMFAAYAELAAVALDSATALADARRQAEVAHALLDLGRALARVTTAEQAAQRLAEAVTRTVGCDMASVYLYDPSRRIMATAGLHGFAPDAEELLRDLEISESDTPRLRTMLDRPVPLAVEHGSGDAFLDPLMEATGGCRAMVVPIVSGARLYGVLSAISRDREIADDGGLLERLAGLADQAVTALQNAELLEAVRHQATHDSLTGTANQRLLAARVDVVLEQARCDGEHVGLLFIDVDRFKAINDTFGHPVGDLALQQVAARVCSSVRDVDMVSRLGGDEFVVLLPRLADPDEAAVVAGRVLTSLEGAFALDHHQVVVSASIGIAVCAGGSATYAELLASADAAMYRAKAAGGNGFCTAVGGRRT